MNIEELVKKHIKCVCITVAGNKEMLSNALTELSETHALELRAYETTVAELQRRVEAQSVAVAGEPVAWANEYCIDEWERSQKDNWSGARLTAKEVPGSTVPLFRKPTNSIPAAELASLRKDAERYRWLRDDAFKHSEDCFFEAGRLFAGHHGATFDAAVDAAIAQGKGE